MDPINRLSKTPRQHVYQVSELNQNIKQLLEEKYPFLWISGEISNFRKPGSGHCYFTLKDRDSQINAVLFRTQASALKFTPEDGLNIVGLGRISVYQPRGTYQVIFEYIEPQGIGALLIAFEKLKQRLAAEGLFDAAHKKPLPILPAKISIVSSPTGAAVRDFINIAQRRFPNLPLEVVPVSVQGERAPLEILRAIQLLNDISETDVIVLARGGGSIEDLSAFNDEQVARSIFASKIPIVSAVGHETDFTLADFVSDLRAPTPSAAAELCVPSKNEFKNHIQKLKLNGYTYTRYILKSYNERLGSIRTRIVHPRRRIQDWRMRLDDYCHRLNAVARDAVARRRERVAHAQDSILHVSPLKTVWLLKSRMDAWHTALGNCIDQTIADRRNSVARHIAMLDALNPMAILKRGYSITRTLPAQSIVYRADQVDVDQRLEVLLGKGKLSVVVNARETDSK